MKLSATGIADERYGNFTVGAGKTDFGRATKRSRT